MNPDRSIDVLMITWRRPEYTRRSLARLLDTCDDAMRVWIWHNGNDPATLEVVHEYGSHPRVHRFHHSPENQRLHAPTNWLLHHATGAHLSKIDDDCLVPDGWADTLRRAHDDEPRFGVLGCWRFQPEDFDPELAMPRIESFPGGHRVLRNCWVEGSGFLMKRAAAARAGLLRLRESFTRYCVRLAAAGWINGWYYPFVEQEHMDDPRARHTMVRTDADLARCLPLSARARGVHTLDDWIAQLRRSARTVQEAPLDPRVHVGARRRVRRLWTRLRGRELLY